MSMLKAIWKAIRQIFIGRKIVDSTEKTKLQLCSEVKTKRIRKPSEKQVATLGELLNNLDESFSFLELPYSKFSWIDRNHVIGLRKLGVHVVHPCHEKKSQADITPKLANKILPAIFCVSFGDSRLDDGEKCYPAVIFGFKQNKLPVGVSKEIGQHYLFGFGYKQISTQTNKNLFWIGGYVTVKLDGSIHLHSELKARQQVIKQRNGKEKTFFRKQWGKASVLEIFCDIKNAEINATNDFARAMDFWLERENQWSVSVRKNDEKVTFAVPKELTSKFFKDRIKILTETGATKPIIHYVHQHERTIKTGKTLVKEHIRGLSKFNWKGYHCRVVAPKFNGNISSSFTLAAEFFEDDEPIPNVKMMGISKLGKLLSDFEESEVIRK